MMNHSCESNKKLKFHKWGPAIMSCWENEDGELWVGNGEYSNQVYFCPYCGYQAKVLNWNREGIM